MNLVLFVPVGLLYGVQATKGTKKQQWIIVFLFGMGFSLGIEVLQLVLKKGSFEIDDIIHNTLGCLIGFVIWQGISKLVVLLGNLKKH